MTAETSWERAITELVEWMSLNDGTVVPFVGAGVSRAVGAPTWGELAERLLDVCIGFQLVAASEVSELKKKTPLEVLTRSRDILGDEVFSQQVSRSLGPANKGAVPKVAQLLWDINPSLVVTTNLDLLVERGGTRAGDVVSTITPRDATRRAFETSGRRVLHLHGALDRFETWVMTQDQYSNAMDPKSAMGSIFQTLLLERVLLFVGFRCDDIDFNMFLNHFKEHFPVGHSYHYALLADPTPEEKKRLLELGIFPISYSSSASNHPEVQAFIEQLIQRHNPRRVLEPIDQQTGSVELLTVGSFKHMTLAERRNQLDSEFRRLFDQTKDYGLLARTDLPPQVKSRRDETLGYLAECWQVGTTPPYNAIDGRDVVDQLGRGGFGVVWKVQDIKTGQHEAMKVAHFSETDNYMFVERFRQGIRAMKLLTAAGIQNIVRYRSDREVPLSVVMDYVDGGDLSNIAPGQLNFVTRLRLMKEITAIIVDAHKIPVYHRDLKPSNVLMTWDHEGEPHAVLSDFDLAWYEGAISRTSTKVGDQAFASPEQLAYGRAVKARDKADVYALGMLAWYLIKEETPPSGQWYNTKLVEEISAVVGWQAKWKVTSSELAQLIGQCAQSNPEARPTAAEFFSTIEAVWTAEEFEYVTEPRFRSEMVLRSSDSDAVNEGTQEGREGVHVEIQRSFGIASVTVIFNRLQSESDEWGRFKYQAQKAMETVIDMLEPENWQVVSRAANQGSARLVIKHPLDKPTLVQASRLAANLSDAKHAWNAKFAVL